MILYLLVLIVLHIPAVQTGIAGKAALLLEEKIGSKVRIGRIDIGLLNRIIVDDVTVMDQQDAEMIKSARLAVKIDVAELIKGKIRIGSAQMFSTHFTISQDSVGGKLNCQFMLDSLASKDPNKRSAPLDLCVSSLIMRHNSIKYDCIDKEPSVEGFDPYHLEINEISAYAQLHILRDDTISADLKKLSMREKSGLEISNITLGLTAGLSGASLTDFKFSMPNSEITAEKIAASFGTDVLTDSISGKKTVRIRPKTLGFSGEITNSNITLADISPLVSSLKDFKGSISLMSSFSGTDTTLVIDRLYVGSTSGDIDIDAEGKLYFGEGRNEWQFNLNRLEASSKSVEFIVENLKGRDISLPEAAKRLGDIGFSGKAEGTGKTSIKADGWLVTGIGNVSLKAKMNSDKTFEGHINTDGLDLGKLADNEDLGQVAADITANGTMPQGKNPTINIKGELSKFSYKGYDYSNLYVDGQYDGLVVSGKMSIDDPNISLLAEGSYGAKGKRKTIKLDLDVEDLSPEAISLSSKWGPARFSASVSADFSGSGIGDSEGSLLISDIEMTSEEDTLNIAKIVITSGYNNGIHTLQADSDFGSATLAGKFDYDNLAQSFTNIVASRLPTLPGLPPANQSNENNFSFMADIDNTDWLPPLLGIPLVINEPLTLWGRVDDKEDDIFVALRMPSLTYDGTDYSDASLFISSITDSISCDMSVRRYSEKGNDTWIKIGIGAAYNRLTTSLIWDSAKGKYGMKGEINAHASMFTDELGRQTATMTIDPSKIEIGGKQWKIKSEGITYLDKLVEIEGLSISHNDQFAMISGRASDSFSDTLSVDFKGIEVGYVLDLVNFHSVEFSGDASGTVTLVAPFGSLSAKAQIDVDNFKFQDGRMGILDARIDYNNEEKQINIHAVADDGPDAKTYIYGLVAPSRKLIDIDFIAEGTYLEFIESFTTNFFADTKGQAWGTLKLYGSPGSLDLTGKVLADFDALITPVNCRYKVEKDTVYFVPNEIEFHNTKIADKNGNNGYVNGSLHHKHLKNMTYDLDISANNMLCYDFRDFGENTFYGTVYATGSMNLHGIRGMLQMDLDITPEKGSYIVYDVGSADEVTDYQEFITWRDYEALDTLETKSTDKGKIAEPIETVNDVSDMYLNFIVNCNPNATIKLLMDSRTNDYITLHGSGVLRASYYNKGPFTMYGTYRVSDGTYDITIQDIIRKNFTFTDGSTLVFGGNPFDAQLNLQASYTVSGVSLSDLNIGNSYSGNTIRVNCLMNIGGVAANPQVTFDLDMPTVSSDEKQMVKSLINSEEEMNQQVVYLLGIGRFYPQGNNNSSTQASDQSETALAMQSLLSGTLSSQINSLLGSVIRSDNWSFGANISTGNDGWNNAEYEGLISGKLLNNRLLINGQFGYRDNVATDNQSFIGDFDIRYLLFPNGNLALRVYNQSNDRYFTKSSLNTQGVGLIMKKDFTNFWDLTGLKKSK